MQPLGILVLAILAAIAGFTALNWAVLSTPLPLSFLLFVAEAPPGLILLAAALVFALIFLGYVVATRTAMLIESRRHARELAALRDVAERAEASRIHELRAELRELGERQAAADRALEDSLRRAIDEAALGIAAHVGQVDDKLDRLR